MRTALPTGWIYTNASNGSKPHEFVPRPRQQERGLKEAPPGQRVRAVGHLFTMRLTKGGLTGLECRGPGRPRPRGYKPRSTGWQPRQRSRRDGRQAANPGRYHHTGAVVWSARFRLRCSQRRTTGPMSMLNRQTPLRPWTLTLMACFRANSDLRSDGMKEREVDGNIRTGSGGTGGPRATSHRRGDAA
jgi:hypothetical protein